MTGEAEWRSNQAVAEAAETRWRASGADVAVFPLVELCSRAGLVDVQPGRQQAIVIQGHRSLELITDDAEQCRHLGPILRSLSDLGWQVSVLAPLAQMGLGHEFLRGASATLQGWWKNEANTYSFTGPERC